MDRRTAAVDAGQKEDGFLNFRGQIQQIHNLADPWPGHVAKVSQFRVIADLAGPEVIGKANRQCHEAR